MPSGQAAERAGLPIHPPRVAHLKLTAAAPPPRPPARSPFPARACGALRALPPGAARSRHLSGLPGAARVRRRRRRAPRSGLPERAASRAGRVSSARERAGNMEVRRLLPEREGAEEEEEEEVCLGSGKGGWEGAGQEHNPHFFV